MELLEILNIQEQESLKRGTQLSYGSESVIFTGDVFSTKYIDIEWKPLQCSGARNYTDSIWSADTRQQQINKAGPNIWQENILLYFLIFIVRMF